MEQSAWEKIDFSRVSKDDIRRILDVGKYMDLDKTPQHTIVEEIGKILLAPG
jgi:hypothetical protein